MNTSLESMLENEITNTTNIKMVNEVLNTQATVMLENESFTEDEHTRVQLSKKLEIDNSDENVRQYFRLRYKTMLYVCALNNGINIDYPTWAAKFNAFSKKRNFFEG